MCAKKKNSSLKKKIGIGVAVAGAAAGAVAAGVAAYRHSKSEQVYHEAELKAMSELDDLNAENAACEGCEEAEETGAVSEEQMSMEDAEPEVPVEEAPEADEQPEQAPEEAPEEEAEKPEQAKSRRESSRRRGIKFPNRAAVHGTARFASGKAQGNMLYYTNTPERSLTR